MKFSTVIGASLLAGLLTLAATTLTGCGPESGYEAASTRSIFEPGNPRGVGTHSHGE